MNLKSNRAFYILQKEASSNQNSKFAQRTPKGISPVTSQNNTGSKTNIISQALIFITFI